MYRGGRPNWLARVQNRMSAIAFAAGIWPKRVASLEVRGRRSGRTISFPVVIADHGGERYLVAMLGNNTNWVRNVIGNDDRKRDGATATPATDFKGSDPLRPDPRGKRDS